jgi:uncharacterized protein YmfQ (DUF2313 family)
VTLQPRDAATFAGALAALLPEGPVWPRRPDSVLMRALAGLAGVLERWATQAWVLLTYEAFPPAAQGMLSDWERVLGLPEPCLPIVETEAERRAAVIEKLQRRPGGQSRAYYIEIARRLGYHHDVPVEGTLAAELGVTVGSTPQVTIREFAPFQCGVSRVGVTLFPDTIAPRWQLGSAQQRFTWRVSVPGKRLTWFRCGPGGGRCGRDSLLRIRRADDLECLLQRLKPAHTVVQFDYSGT